MNRDEARDRLVDTLLREAWGGEEPPDLSARVLRCAFPEQSFFARGKSKRVDWRLWGPAFAAAALMGVVVGLWLVLANRPDAPIVEDHPPEKKTLARQPQDNPPVRQPEVPEVEDPFRPGTIVQTHGEPKKIELAGYCALELKPHSTLKIEQAKGTGGAHTTQVTLQAGGLESSITPGQGGFAVRTELGAVSVLGTRFMVKLARTKGDRHGEGEGQGHRLEIKVAEGKVKLDAPMGDLVLSGEQKEGGVFTGLLVGKDREYKNIEVKADYDDGVLKLGPRWTGGMPDAGGGPDKSAMERIAKVYPNHRVRVLWVRDEGPRVVNVELLPPDAKEGTDEGRVTFIGDALVELRTVDGIWDRYAARQIKGDGGRWRPDPDTMHQIARLKKGDRVRVRWKYGERKQIVRIEGEGLDAPRDGKADPREGADRKDWQLPNRKEGDRPHDGDKPREGDRPTAHEKKEQF